MPGLQVGREKINNLRYAQGTVLIVENKMYLQNLQNFDNNEIRKKGFDSNSKQLEVMAISKRTTPEYNVFINESI